MSCAAVAPLIVHERAQHSEEALRGFVGRLLDSIKNRVVDTARTQNPQLRAA